MKPVVLRSARRLGVCGARLADFAFRQVTMCVKSFLVQTIAVRCHARRCFLFATGCEELVGQRRNTLVRRCQLAVSASSTPLQAAYGTMT